MPLYIFLSLAKAFLTQSQKMHPGLTKHCVCVVHAVETGHSHPYCMMNYTDKEVPHIRSWWLMDFAHTCLHLLSKIGMLSFLWLLTGTTAPGTIAIMAIPCTGYINLPNAPAFCFYSVFFIARAIYLLSHFILSSYWYPEQIHNVRSLQLVITIIIY